MSGNLLINLLCEPPACSRVRARREAHRRNCRCRAAISIHDKPDAVTSSFSAGLQHTAGHPGDRQNARAVPSESACLFKTSLPVIAFRCDDGKLHTQRAD